METKKTILLLEDSNIETAIFSNRLKSRGLQDKYNIELITVTNPVDGAKVIRNKKVDLVVSDILNTNSNPKEMEKFLRYAHKKSKIMFLSGASWNEVPKLENVPLIPKFASREYYGDKVVNLKEHQDHIYNTIEQMLISTKPQNISSQTFSKIMNPDYHKSGPNQKKVNSMLSNFGNLSTKKKQTLSDLLQLEQLRKELRLRNTQNHSKEQMNELLTKYINLSNKFAKSKLDIEALKHSTTKPKIVRKHLTKEPKKRIL